MSQKSTFCFFPSPSCIPPALVLLLVSFPDPRFGRHRARFSLLPALALLAVLSLFAAAPAAAQRTVPDEPRNVQVTAGDGQLTLTWAAPASWGSFPAFRFEIDWRIGTTGDWLQVESGQGRGVTYPISTATSYTFSGRYRVATINNVRQYHTVANGTAYQLRIRAVSKNPHDDTDHLPGFWVVRSGTPQSLDATLSGLTASSSTSAGGSYSALGLSPSTFSPTTTSYTATVADSITHAKLTPTVNHASASVTVNGTTVTSGTASGAIALSEGSNAITVRVTAQDETTKDYTVTITRQVTTPTVSLSASPNPVEEGERVNVSVRLSEALPRLTVNIPVTVTAGTAEADDYVAISNIVIPPGSLSSFGFGTMTTNQDDDTDDETFTVALDTANLPSTVTAGRPSSVTITIRDDDGVTTPTVSLSASPNPVEEGERVNVSVRLSEALPRHTVNIPVTVTAGTAESGDYEPISNIVIPPGSLSSFGFGTMITNQDDDTDDETFTVALDTANLPSSVTAGRPSSVTITIRDDDGGSPPDDGLPPDDGGSPPDDNGGSPPDDNGGGDGGVSPPDNGGGDGDGGGGGVSPPDDDGGDDDGEGDGDDDGSEVPTAVNRSPEAADDRARTKEDTEVVIDVLSNDTDVDGDALRVVSVTAPSLGTARISDGGAGVFYAPEADRHGTDRFSYEVSDGSGGTATAEVEVTVESVNDAPVAAPDTGRTREDTEVSLDVLSNDTDVDGDALRVVSVTAPSLGTARISDGGAGVFYAPEADRHGTDRFSYEVSDGSGGTATAEVEVTVEPVNDAPVAAPDTARTREDTKVVLNVLSNDTDVDGDALRVVSVTAPSLGTARIADGGTGVLYAPEADRHGTDRFSYEVSDGHGGMATAEVEVTVDEVNDAPVAVVVIPDQTLDEGGADVAIDLAPHFEDRDGDALAYSAVSSDPGLVAVTVAGSMLTLKAVGYGNTTVEVMARDPDGLEARQTFRVGASDRMVRAALDETLAAMGRAHLASARMTLGRYLGPSGLPGSSGATGPSRLTVMGITIPLDAGVTREAAGQLLGQPRAFDGLRYGGGSTELLYQWGGGDGGGSRWRLWSQGDIQTYAADPTAMGASYDGDLRSGWVGIDRTVGDRWLTGLAFARSNGAGDWRSGKASGALETTIAAIYPYLSWSDGRASVWALGGLGRGTAQNLRSGGRVGDSDLTLGLGLFEVRRSIAGWFGLRADGGWVRLSTADGAESVDGHLATVDQQRLGIELNPSSRHVGLALQASARRDGGAGQTGTGMELSGGIRVAGGPFRIDAQGRILVLHSSENYEERGLGARISIGSPSAEEGLSLSVSPRWGGPAVASGALWREKMVATPARGPGAREAWTVDSSARYAHRLSGGSLVFLSGGVSSSARGLAIVVSGGIAPGATRR